MTFLAAACGILIVLLGVLTGGRNPTEAQATTEIVCLVGGLVLCFLAVVLARIRALDRRLEGFEIVPPAADAPGPAAASRPPSAKTPPPPAPPPQVPPPKAPPPPSPPPAAAVKPAAASSPVTTVANS